MSANPLLMLVALAATEGSATPAEALEAAMACYRELDYGCAEERLAWALAGRLTAAQQKRARLYEALLAYAHRDDQRTRRAVRAVLSLDRDYDPGAVPPGLLTIFEQERPPPPPPPRALARLDVTGLVLSGGDALRWSDGLGLEAGGGVLLLDALVLEASVGFSDHRPRERVLTDLGLLSGALHVGWRGDLGPVRLGVALGGGPMRVSIDGVLRDSSYWATLITAPVELVWPIWAGFGLGARAGAGLVVTTSEDRAVSSWVFPLSVGLRYAP